MARSAFTCAHCGHHGVPRLVDVGEVCRRCGRDVERPPAIETWVSVVEEAAPLVLDALNAPGGRRISMAEVWRRLDGAAAKTTVGKALRLLAEQGLVNRDKQKRWGRVPGATNPYATAPEPRTSAPALSRIDVRAHWRDAGGIEEISGRSLQGHAVPRSAREEAW